MLRVQCCHVATLRRIPHRCNPATITPVRVPGQENLARAGIISHTTGSAQIEHLGTVRWSYHFDHNALKDAELVAGNLVALTESGNLVRFDSGNLSIAGNEVVPGRGISIARGFGGKLLIGAEDGQVFDVNSKTLALTPVTKANGRVLWLCTGKVSESLIRLWQSLMLVQM